MTGKDIKIYTLNVRGMRSRKDRKKLFMFLSNLDYDVYMLQETHSAEQDIELWQKEWSGKSFYSHGATNSRGVAILFKSKDVECEIKYTDRDGRIIIIECEIKKQNLTLCCIYAPNTDEPSFFSNSL